MKRIEDQTYYELLEVSPDATPKEIQQAYDRARETFQLDSIAIYSLFPQEEVMKIQAAIEEAYRVLKDEESRRSYDQSCSHLFKHLSRAQQAPPSEKMNEMKQGLSFTDIALEIKDIPYRGTSLRQLREQLGIDLKTIAAQTKINPRILESIENEELDRLPAPVYLKGFLKAYARVLNIDPQRLIEGYFQLFEERKKK